MPLSPVPRMRDVAAQGDRSEKKLQAGRLRIALFSYLCSIQRYNMRRLLSALIIILLSLPSARGRESVAEQLVRSEMYRNPEPCYIDRKDAPKWEYTGGLEIGAMLDVYSRCLDERIREYAFQYIDSFVMPDGTIRSYRLTDYNLDRVNPGKTLFQFYRLTGEDRFLQALHLLRTQLRQHPRNADGGYWHKKVYPHQVWLDGVYMATPFLAEYTRTFEPDNREAYADAVNQILMAARHTYDAETGLYRHACDVSRQMQWADPATGQSRHCWGRALGWYMMAIVDALPFLPDDIEGRDSILHVLRTIAEGLERYKDRQTGLWYQVLDSPTREGNYLESSSSAMFIYSMLKAVRLGYLPPKYRRLARSSYRSFLRQFVSHADTEQPCGKPLRLLSIGSCCAVAGLSDSRPGTFDYYISEPRRDNDPKVVGPFLRAALEMQHK